MRVKAFKQLIDKKLLLTTEEAAEIMGVKESAVRGFTRRKRKKSLPVIKIGKCMLYKKADLIKFIKFIRLTPEEVLGAVDNLKKTIDSMPGGDCNKDQEGPGSDSETPEEKEKLY